VALLFGHGDGDVAGGFCHGEPPVDARERGEMRFDEGEEQRDKEKPSVLREVSDERGGSERGGFWG
jgi:hypothetical protein